jgi:hypothetical protein
MACQGQTLIFDIHKLRIKIYPAKISIVKEIFFSFITNATANKLELLSLAVFQAILIQAKAET